MVISHTMPVIPVQSMVAGPPYPPPSVPPPAHSPAAPPGRASVFVGSLVVAFAAVVLIVVGVRVLPRLRPSAAAAPPPAQVSPPPVVSAAPPPPPAASEVPSAVVSTAMPPPPASVSASASAPPKRVPIRPVPRVPADGIPSSRGVPSSRE